MITDRVGDFIIRLQNAARAGRRTVLLPHSAYLLAIAKKLKELRFIDSVEIKTENSSVKKNIAITLAYDENGNARLRGVKRISKPGRRLYTPHAAMHSVKGGTGFRLVSSPTGILSDKEARKNRVGGEELFEVW